MSFKQRLLIFILLWLLAGLVCAIFSEGTAEAGDNAFLDRLRFLYLAPLISAMGVAFTLVHRDYDTVSAAWQQRGHYEEGFFWLLLAVFVVHAVITLTRRTRRQFIMLSVMQVVFLAFSVPCVLYFYHYEATHGHG